MKLSRILFKPKWQDKDTSARLAAVASGNDPELIDALPELTRTDPDVRVRLAALKRLGDYERWRERSTADADPELRRVSRTTYIALLCAGGQNVPALPRLIAELDTLTATELETVATGAANRELRRVALGLVKRPALLAERAVADSDPALRLAALERVTDIDSLERIAERLRKSDKTASRLARERVQILRIGAGDAAAISIRARELCERVENLVRHAGAGMATAVADAQRAWAGLGAQIPAELAARFAGSLALAERLSRPRVTNDQAALGDRIALEASIAMSEPAPLSEDPVRPSGTGEEADNAIHANEGEVRADVVARHHALHVTHRDDAGRDREREQCQSALRRIEELIPAYERNLDAGDTAAALALHTQLIELVRVAGPRAAGLHERLAPLHARFAELRRWQIWSNRRRRRALCDEIEKLAGSGLHPDAIANRVNEARIEWHRLDAIEGAGTAADGAGLARRFHAVCQQVLKPAHAYFEKRDAVRDSHREQIESLLADAKSMHDAGADWKRLATVRHDLAATLRTLDAVSPRDRSKLAKRIKDAIAAVSSPIEAHHREIESAKARLIERANGLAEHADRDAARNARELQQQWTALGEGLRSIDQKQWREFRAACDRIFASLDAGRKEREEQATKNADQARAIVEEAEALARDPAPDSQTLVARRRDLESRWRAAAADDSRLDKRWRLALDLLTAKAADHARDSRRARFTVALRKYSLLRELERGQRQASMLAAEWETGAALDPGFAAPLSRRWTLACGAEPEAGTPGGDEENARDLLVRLEFSAGAASPAGDRQRRMDYQVARLSARMRGATTMAPEAELDMLFSAWFEQTPQSEELEQRFETAAKNAIEALP